MKKLWLLFAAATIMLAADKSIEGTWTLETEVQGYQGKAVCTVKQEGSKLTGSCKNEGAAKPADITGQITGEKFVFQHGGEYNGEALTISYSGKFDSETTLSGEMNVAPFDAAGSFKATKKP